MLKSGSTQYKDMTILICPVLVVLLGAGPGKCLFGELSLPGKDEVEIGAKTQAAKYQSRKSYKHQYLKSPGCDAPAN